MKKPCQIVPKILKVSVLQVLCQKKSHSFLKILQEHVSVCPFRNFDLDKTHSKLINICHIIFVFKLCDPFSQITL